MRRAFVAAAAAAALSSIAAAQQAPRDTAVPFGVGETLTYDVTYATMLTAGTAVSKVEARQSSSARSSYQIVVEGRPVPMLAKLYNLYYRMETLLDTVTLLPHRMSLYSEEGTRRRTSTTRFDRSSNTAFFEVQSDTKTAFTFDVPLQIQDGLSALYVLRTMSIKPGDTFSLPVVDEGSLYRVSARVGPPEQVVVPLGTFEGVRLDVSIVDAEGQMAAKNAGVWVSTDSRRLPLKMQADLAVGSFVLLLRSAAP